MSVPAGNVLHQEREIAHSAGHVFRCDDVLRFITVQALDLLDYHTDGDTQCQRSVRILNPHQSRERRPAVYYDDHMPCDLEQKAIRDRYVLLPLSVLGNPPAFPDQDSIHYGPPRCSHEGCPFWQKNRRDIHIGDAKLRETTKYHSCSLKAERWVELNSIGCE